MRREAGRACLNQKDLIFHKMAPFLDRDLIDGDPAEVLELGPAVALVGTGAGGGPAQGIVI